MTIVDAPRRRLRTNATSITLACVALAATTAIMLAFRDRLDKAHVALLYLLVVLAGSAIGARAVGIAIGGLAFLLFNFFFLPPYFTLAVTDPLDWLVLLTFLATSLVATELLDRQRRQADRATARTRELDRLSTLGAETLNAARADQALAGIADVIRQTVVVDACELFVWEGDEVTRIASSYGAAMATPPESRELLKYVASTKHSAIEREDGTIHVVEHTGELGDATSTLGKAFALALSARGETVGALRVSSARPFELSVDQRRVLSALAYYAALGIYRLRLERAEETTEALRRADRLKDSLLAAVSHDLRTPLTTIKGIAHEIADSGQPRASIIEDEADRLASLVDGLLEMSQLDAGALRLAPEVNTVDDLLSAALQRSFAVLRGRSVEVENANDEMLMGRFDLSHSLRIVVNLLENAAKYSPAAAPISVRTRRAGPNIEIAVADHGLGIPVAERERVFEPFYRIPGATADVRGAGLGLSIARRLANAQGGSLAITESSGGGSVFTLVLPGATLPSF